MGRPQENLVGRAFGRLTVVEMTNKRRSDGVLLVRCLCECGNYTEIIASSLKTGRTKSCGCLRDEIAVKHGGKRRSGEEPAYTIWRGIRGRCNEPNHISFKYYGALGIRLCKEWDDYAVFRDYIVSLPNCPKNALIPGSALNLTIDRIRTKGHYAPGNIRWATDIDQANNRSNNRTVRVNGESMSLAEAVKKYSKVSYGTTQRRLDRGWSMKDAFLTPA